MCDETGTPGFLARQWYAAQGARLNARDEARASAAAPATRPVPTMTQKAQTGLVVVGAIVLLASAGAILHALLVAVVAVAALGVLVVAGLVGLRARRPRQPGVLPERQVGAGGRQALRGQRAAIGPPPAVTRVVSVTTERPRDGRAAR
jgi:hypothetical protein